jgi:hypothetical protein
LINFANIFLVKSFSQKKKEKKPTGSCGSSWFLHIRTKNISLYFKAPIDISVQSIQQKGVYVHQVIWLNFWVTSLVPIEHDELVEIQWLHR